MPLAECGGACASSVVLLEPKGFAVRALELRELGRNPNKDMSGRGAEQARGKYCGSRWAR
jgi:hypothetical protein